MKRFLTYSDEETKILTKRFDITKYEGKNKTICNTLGSWEREEAARQILLVDKRKIVGLAKEDLEYLLKDYRCSFYLITECWADPFFFNKDNKISTIEAFLEQGYLRNGDTKENRVVYPTQKLLENQKVPLRKQNYFINTLKSFPKLYERQLAAP